MYTMVVQMSTDASRVEQVARHLREDVVEFAKQQPGFVSGQWLHSADGSKAMGVVVFASEEAATSATQGPRNLPRDDERAWNIESVTVYERLTSA
jgi:hypothetical protein